MQRLVLLDTHAIIHRAYHALPPLTTPAGEPANAVYGFISILLRILRELSPDYIAAASDLPGPTFRHEVSEAYKAQRPEAAEDLVSQFTKVKEALAVLGIAVFEREGYEADDVIGTIAEKFKKDKGIEVIVVTGDADAFQLVRPRLKVYMMRKGITESVMYDEAAVRERYGLRPDQIVDFKALKGDPSDNIAGVKGVGEKTATELLQRFDTVEGIYRALAKKDKRISPAIAEKLAAGREDARISRTLAAIATDAPFAIALDDLVWQDGEALLAAARPLLEQWGFTSLVRRLASRAEGKSKSARSRGRPGQGGQMSLLGDAAPEHSLDDAVKTLLRLASASPLGVLMADQETLVLVNDKTEIAAAKRDALKDLPVRAALARHPELAGHDAKSVIKFLRSCGIARQDFSFDTMLAGYVLESSLPDFSYAAVAARALGTGDPAENVGRFFDVVERLRKKIVEDKLEKVFYEIELPLVRILADMEERGVLIDQKFLAGLGRDAKKRISALKRKIYALAGEEFNINSSQQLSRILFDVLKIPVRGLRKTEKGGVVSTRESELEKLRSGNPIVEQILDYRELTKITSTYIDALPALVNPKTERIHTTFNQTGTSTGRLSSSNPNLQNIPILSEFGRKIRNAFVASPGFHLVSFDYSQIELRVAAHLAHDAKMIDAFRRGVDIHKLTASEVYNVPLDQVTPELRRQAKTLNFGVLYGMGANAFAEATGMDRDQAKQFIDEYFRDFSGIYAYVEAVKEFARSHGYVETLFGRRRYIPEILSGGLRARRDAERMAVNMPIQGCLPYGTRVFTSQGYMEIGRLAALDSKKRPQKVWDGTQWRRYSVLNRGKAQLAEISLGTGHILQCDTRHVILVATEDGYIWKTFFDLKRGDRVCSSFPVPLEFEKLPRVSFSYHPSVVNGIDVDIKNLREDFWYWMGYYYGDGWFQKRIMQHKNNYEKLSLYYVFGYQEKEKCHACVAYFASIGMRPHIRTMKPTTRRGHQRFVVTIESQGLGLFLKMLGIVPGARAKTKRFPSRIYSESLKNRKAFLKGFLDADGWYGRNSRDVSTIHISQEELLQDTHLLLRTIGIRSTIRGPYEYNRQISYFLNIPYSLLHACLLGIPSRNKPKGGHTTPQFLIREFLSQYPGLSKQYFTSPSDYTEYRRWKNGGSCSISFFSDFLKRYNLRLKSPLYDFTELKNKKVLRKYDITYTLSVEESHRFDSEGVISKNTATGDIVKLAMIAADRWIRDGGYADRMRLLLQVHDELLFEVKKNFVEEAAREIKRIMENVVALGVPLVVDAKAGANWGNQKPINQ